MKRGLLIAALPLVLGGCLPILPPAIQLASTGLSGVAFLATGKSTTDHLISAAVDEDCSLLRVAFGDEPCHEYQNEGEKPLTELVAFYPGDRDDWVDSPSIPKGEVSGKTILSLDAVKETTGVFIASGERDVPPVIVIASDEEETSVENELLPDSLNAKLDPFGGLGVTGFAPATFEPIKVKDIDRGDEDLSLPLSATQSWKLETGSAPVGKLEQKSDAMTVLPLPRPDRQAKSANAASGSADHFVMLGSFRTIERAESLKDTVRASASSTAPLPAPVIMSVRLKGSLWHRVAVGPFTSGEAVAMATALEPISGKKAWAAKVSD